MKIPRQTTVCVLMAIAASLFVGGCASPNRHEAVQPPIASQSYVHYGVIDSIQTVQGNSETSGAGAIVGGVAGGLLGNQIGGGTGRAVATVAGAVGGALVGNEVEQANRSHQLYQINVRLDSGNYILVTQAADASLRVGDRVRVEKGQVYR